MIVCTGETKNHFYLYIFLILRKMSSPASLASLSAISKASFGSDPRNANHPLSISQLTSSHKVSVDVASLCDNHVYLIMEIFIQKQSDK